MRAVALSTFGGPEVLQVLDLPDPEPASGEVRVRVRAATVNPTDLGFRSGRSAEVLAAFPAPYVPGMEFAGVVEAPGADSRWKVGEPVMGIIQPQRGGRGAQAELVVVADDSLAPVPRGASFEAAATLPMNGLTVRRALDLLGLAPGESLVVTGAAGAVGGYAVQLGKVDGLRVIAIAAERDRDLVRSFGADEFVTRGPEAIETAREVAGGGGAAGLIDAAVLGAAALAAVRDDGAFASVRAFDAPTERGITLHQVRVSDYLTNAPALEALRTLVEEGRLTLRVAETFTPPHAARAHELLSAGGVRGRLVIIF